MGDRHFAVAVALCGLTATAGVTLLVRCAGRGGAPAAPPGGQAAREASYDAHLAELQTRVPDGFTVVVEEPFVVIGDEHPETVKMRAATTIRGCVEALRGDFFENDPEDIVDIWLFRDADSYEKHALALFGHPPHTPYGYYSSADGVLVMNIATGGGTLVHEIVHPFMEANFPACPAWFDEGLGSLYEQCVFDDGHLVGLPNWRLPGLQEAVRQGALPSFSWLTSRTDDQFYGEDPGTNYAQSRYLLMYVQDRGLLVEYYHAFVAAHEKDPTGWKTLLGTLDEEDPSDFRRRWEEWVLGLRFE